MFFVNNGREWIRPSNILSIKNNKNILTYIKPQNFLSFDAYDTKLHVRFESVCWSTNLHRLVAISADGIIEYSDDLETFHHYSLADQNINYNGWSYIYYSEQAETFLAVCYNSNIIMSSKDGLTWNIIELDTTAGYDFAYYAFDKFYVIGQGIDFCYSSTDLVVWSKHQLPSSLTWYSMAYSSTLNAICLIASTDNDIGAISYDGVNFSQIILPAKGFWHSISYSPQLEMFCVVGAAQSGISQSWACTSYDGINWRINIISNEYRTAETCVWNHELMSFVCTYLNSPTISISDDGIKWNDIDLSQYIETGINIGIRALTSVNGQIFAYEYIIDNAEKEINRFLSKKIGVEHVSANSLKIADYAIHANFYIKDNAWRMCYTTNFNYYFQRMNSVETNVPSAYAKCWSPDLKKFCIISHLTDDVGISSDGINWEYGKMPANDVQWYSVVWNHDRKEFCAVAKNTDAAANTTTAVSSDGLNWTIGYQNEYKQAANCVCYSSRQKKYCVIMNGAIGTPFSMISNDGINWQVSTTVINTNYGGYGICFAEELNIFVAISQQYGWSAVSADGFNWTFYQNVLPTDKNYAFICYSPLLNLFCTTGTVDCQTCISNDGINWTIGTQNTYKYLYGIIWIPEFKSFVAHALDSDNNCCLISSNDGLYWQKFANLPHTEHLYRYLTYAPEIGKILTSIASTENNIYTVVSNIIV